MMDYDEIDVHRIVTAEEEAERFLKRVTSWREAQKRDGGYCPVERAALKRASMDLTRALADVRRSRYQ